MSWRGWARFSGWFSCVLLAVASVSPAAHAQEDMSPEVRAEGRRRIAECEAHAEAERFAVAADCYQALYEFMQAHRLDRAPLILFNIGHVLSRVPGREREARDALQRFLNETVGLARSSGSEVETFRSEGAALITELDARLRATPSGSGEGSIAWPGPAVLAVGAGMLLAGGILGAFVLADNDAIVRMCPGGNCSPDLRDDAEGLQMRGLAADILLIGGAAVAAVGLVLTLVLRDGGPERPVTAVCGPELCGLLAQGVF